MPIKVKINVGKIDKEALYKGAKGTYLDVVLWETPDDQYGNDYRVVQDLPRERRDAGERGEILGDAKNFGNSKAKAKQERQAPPGKRMATDKELDDASDSVPF